MPVRVRYYTDPACSASWAAEPERRALLVEFGNGVPFTYVMSGLARDYDAGDSEAMLVTWLDHAAESRMPTDPRLWVENPLGSTYPACMAVKAATEQGPEAAERYLRAAREGLMCFRRKLDSTEPLAEVAREAGLDVARFRVDLDSNAIVEAFGRDLEESRTPPDEARERHGVKDGRLVHPTVRFEGEVEAWVFGQAPYEEWRAAALAAGAAPVDEPRPDPLEALRRFGRMASVEVEASCDLAPIPAEAELWRLAGEGRVRPVRVATGVLWELA